MTTVTFHCARAWLGGAGLERDVAVTATDGVIDAVAVGSPAPRGAALLDGVVLPGLANGHSHAFHRALRGRKRDDLDSFWAWRDQMYELAVRLTPDVLHELAIGAFSEMLCAGYTAVGEFHYLHHDRDGARYADPNEMSRAILDAAQTTGIRLTLLDACYLESAPGTPPSGAQLRFADASVSEWTARADALVAPSERVVVGGAIHSVRAVPPAGASVVAAWAASRSAPLHAHVSEQPSENEVAREAYGVTPTALLADAGALSDRFTAVHATHLVDGDRARLGDAGASVCVCPTTERDLGDGLVELARLVDAEIPLTLGSDSHAVVDPFDELRALEGHERLRTLRRGTCGPDQLLIAATASGHRSLGWSDGGRIAPGAPCDLVHVSTDAARLAGTGDDAAGLLAAATAADVRTVVVAGEPLVEDGRHRRVDTASVLDTAIRAVWS